MSSAVLVAAGATAQPQMFIASVGALDAVGDVAIGIVVLNESDRPRGITVASELGGQVNGRPVRLIRDADQAGGIVIPPHGFARIRYRLPGGPDVAAGGTVAIAGTGGGVAIASSAMVSATSVSADAPTSRAAAAHDGEGVPRQDAGGVPARRGLFANLAPYAPIYAVYGPGTNTDARIQIGFQYQLFGSAGDDHAFLNRLGFAYTQQMFWDLGRDSSPFRDVAYMPELFYRAPLWQAGDALRVDGRIGIRHESNGRGGAASRSFNTIYVQPMATMPLGGYRLSVGPRIWTYVGRRTDNPDIARYRGRTGLAMSFGRDDGVRIDAIGRLNPRTGKGALDADVSYPLTSLSVPSVNLYLVAQLFRGFGEDLLDYNRHQTRARLGLGIVR